MLSLMPANGPAIKGDCVTRRIRLEGNAPDSRHNANEPEKEVMAHFLPSRYRILGPYDVAVQSCQGVSQLSRCS